MSDRSLIYDIVILIVFTVFCYQAYLGNDQFFVRAEQVLDLLERVQGLAGGVEATGRALCGMERRLFRGRRAEPALEDLLAAWRRRGGLCGEWGGVCFGGGGRNLPSRISWRLLLWPQPGDSWSFQRILTRFKRGRPGVNREPSEKAENPRERTGKDRIEGDGMARGSVFPCLCELPLCNLLMNQCRAGALIFSTLHSSFPDLDMLSTCERAVFIEFPE